MLLKVLGFFQLISTFTSSLDSDIEFAAIRSDVTSCIFRIVMKAAGVSRNIFILKKRSMTGLKEGM